MKRQYYVLSDDGNNPHGAKWVKDPKSLIGLNAKGMAPFWTVNLFPPKKRKELDVEHLQAFYVDIDTGSKESIMEKATYSLKPSCIVETKAGYHLYWYISDNMIDELGKQTAITTYKEILRFRIVPHFNGDVNATDAARLLRVPGFMHQKDPNNKFRVKLVYEDINAVYSWKVVEKAFSWVEPNIEKVRIKNKLRKAVNFVSNEFWDKVYGLDCMKALEALSGLNYVDNEVYSFRPVSGGNWNVYVNDKGTSCWIDHEGHIGSHSNGGPTIIQWLRWYGHSYKEAVNIIKELFPEIES